MDFGVNAESQVAARVQGLLSVRSRRSAMRNASRLLATKTGAVFTISGTPDRSSFSNAGSADGVLEARRQSGRCLRICLRRHHPCAEPPRWAIDEVETRVRRQLYEAAL